MGKTGSEMVLYKGYIKVLNTSAGIPAPCCRMGANPICLCAGVSQEVWVMITISIVVRDERNESQSCFALPYSCLLGGIISKD